MTDQEIANVIYTEMRRQSEQDGPFTLMVTPAVGAESFTGTALIDGEVNLTAVAAALRAAGYIIMRPVTAEEEAENVW